jgi:seryl-tRNA synthetase
MLDIKNIRENGPLVKEKLLSKKVDADIDGLLELDARWRQLNQEADELKFHRNKTSEEINRKKKAKEDASEMILAMREIGAKIKSLDAEIGELARKISDKLLYLPNIPSETTPLGKSEADNVEIRRNCDILPEFDFPLKNHLELGNALGLFDFERGAKISGSNFPLYTGRGAKLERSLINFMLDLHTSEHGYTEIFPPFLTNIASTTTTGQLPKLAEDMYFVGGDELYLIPTAEVPVTNIHRDEVLSLEQIPTKYAAFSACFRREAGSYGKDTRGLQRLHQFNKVELVHFAHPEYSYDNLQEIVKHATTVLEKLELPYRIIELCTADLSFAAAKCFDIELWSPAEKKWLEVSSCSNFEDFQARRGNIRFRDENGKLRFVHTLNGSGVATPRLMIALLENHQQADGSISIPKALQPYVGAATIS